MTSGSLFCPSHGTPQKIQRWLESLHIYSSSPKKTRFDTLNILNHQKYHSNIRRDPSWKQLNQPVKISFDPSKCWLQSGWSERIRRSGSQAELFQSQTFQVRCLQIRNVSRTDVASPPPLACQGTLGGGVSLWDCCTWGPKLETLSTISLLLSQNYQRKSHTNWIIWEQLAVSQIMDDADCCPMFRTASMIQPLHGRPKFYTLHLNKTLWAAKERESSGWVW